MRSGYSGDKLRDEKCTCFSEIEVERKEPGITGNPVALFQVTVEANTDGGIRFRTSIDATCKVNPLLKTISVFFFSLPFSLLFFLPHPEPSRLSLRLTRITFKALV